MTKKRYDKPAMSVNVAEFAAANFPDPNRKILFTEWVVNQQKLVKKVLI